MSKNWWAKASNSLTSNTEFSPSCPSYLSLVISSPTGDDEMVGACVRKSPSQWHPCNNTGRDMVLWIYPGLSKSSEHWEPLSVTDSATDAWGLSRQCQTMQRGCGPAERETRLFSPLIFFPISFFHLLSQLSAESGHPPIQLFLCGKGHPLAAALPVCSPWHPAFCLSLLMSPAVGMRSVNSGERSKAKPGLWAVRLLHIEWSAITVHSDLLFLQDKCFCDKQWQSLGFSSIGGSSNWYMMSDKIIESWNGLYWKGP